MVGAPVVPVEAACATGPPLLGMPFTRFADMKPFSNPKVPTRNVGTYFLSLGQIKVGVNDEDVGRMVQHAVPGCTVYCAKVQRRGMVARVEVAFHQREEVRERINKLKLICAVDGVYDGSSYTASDLADILDGRNDLPKRFIDATNIQ